MPRRRHAGGVEKVRYIVDELGFDAGVDHRASDFADKLKAVCPKGIDIYFEKGELYKVVFRLNLKGGLIPVSQKKPNEVQLENFRWLDRRRPKSKYELFQ